MLDRAHLANFTREGSKFSLDDSQRNSDRQSELGNKEPREREAYA